TPSEAGVLGVVAGVVGTLQANEAIKLILGLGESLSGKLLLFDALSCRFDALTFERKADCPVCGDNPSITTLQEYAIVCDATDGVSQIEAKTVLESIGTTASAPLLDVRTN